MLLSLLLCFLQEVRSWRGDDSPMANGAGAAVHRRQDREPEKEEKKETLKTSQVGRVLGCVGWQRLGDKLSSCLLHAQQCLVYSKHYLHIYSMKMGVRVGQQPWSHTAWVGDRADSKVGCTES